MDRTAATRRSATLEPKFCRCQCGTPVKSPRSEFAPGHQARVAARAGRGIHAVRERPFCACECGERVQKPGSLYRSGHWSPSPEARAQHDVQQPNRHPVRWQEVRLCLICGVLSEVTIVRGRKWLGCSTACRGAAKRALVPWNDLQREILKWTEQQKKRVRDMERLCERSLRYWFKHPQSTIAKSALVAIARVLGMTLQQATSLAGGRTTSDVRRDQAQSNPYFQRGSDERKSAASLGGSVHGKSMKVGRPPAEESRGKTVSALMATWPRPQWRPVRRLLEGGTERGQATRGHKPSSKESLRQWWLDGRAPASIEAGA
jgi:hypothetical protein